MSKFKFGDKVHVLKPYYDDEKDVGIIMRSENAANTVRFGDGGFVALVPDDSIKPVSEWIPCSDELPEIDSATRESNEVFFEDLDGTIYQGWFREGGSDEHSMYFIANLYAEVKSIDKVIRWMYVPS